MCMDNCIKRYENKIVLVTGAGRGIGAAIAARFAKEGAAVIVNYSGNDEAADRTVKNILDANGKAEKYKCQVDSYEETEKMITYIMDKYKRIDILINNAGITKDGLIMRMKEEDFDRVIDVNLKGTFNCIRHVSRYMLKQRSGRIINMSSVVGIAGNAGQVNYSASKAGVIGITKSAAKELASRGITVNAVAPGYIDTDMTKVLSDEQKKSVLDVIPLSSTDFFCSSDKTFVISDEQKKSVLDVIPLSRMGSVDDISNAVAFLASDEAAYITGQVISVDGGMNI